MLKKAVGDFRFPPSVHIDSIGRFEPKLTAAVHRRFQFVDRLEKDTFIPIRAAELHCPLQ